jgi:uroporphyrinogen decarboxylase
VTLTRTPELAAEVTLQPLRRFELDAAILFSDIMTPLQGMGVDLTFEPGPVVREPIRTDAQIDALAELVPERDVPFVLESIKLIRPNVPRGAPLIGFAGGPFTLLCYLVCGKPFEGVRRGALVPVRAARVGRAPARQTRGRHGAYLGAQAAAGAQALMMFESWAGLLAAPEFNRFALRAVRRTMAALRAKTDVPLIYYVNQGSALMESVADLDVDVIGVDWRSSLKTSGASWEPGKPCRATSIPPRCSPSRRT